LFTEKVSSDFSQRPFIPYLTEECVSAGFKKVRAFLLWRKMVEVWTSKKSHGRYIIFLFRIPLRDGGRNESLIDIRKKNYE